MNYRTPGNSSVFFYTLESSARLLKQPLKDFYKRPKTRYRSAELKIKSSKFIAEIVPVETRGDAESALSAIRKETYDAHHHCFAYRLSPNGSDVRAADDGEPNGTAGKPILAAIEASGMTDTLLVVTRYFGGTKLGTGGLARAYAEAANLALTGVETELVYLTDTFEIRVDFEDISTFERMLQRYEAVKLAQMYTEAATTQVAVRQSRVDAFLLELRDGLHGRAVVSKR